jgi:hypothetical protein
VPDRAIVTPGPSSRAGQAHAHDNEAGDEDADDATKRSDGNPEE